MSLKPPPLILEKWFRGLISLCRVDVPTQFFDGVMGSAHTHKCPHTRRNRVCCHKNNNPKTLSVYRFLEIVVSPAGNFIKKVCNFLKLLGFSVYKFREETAL